MPQKYQYIKLPDGQMGKFNADASDSQIRAAIEHDYPGTYRGVWERAARGVGSSLAATATAGPGAAYSGIANLVSDIKTKGLKRAVTEGHLPPEQRQSLPSFLGQTLNPLNLFASDELHRGDIAGFLTKTLTNIAQAEALSRAGKTSLANRAPNSAIDRIVHAVGPESEGVPTDVRAKNALPELKATAPGLSRSLGPLFTATLDRLEGQFKSHLDKLRGKSFSGEPIAQAIEAKITPEMRLVDQGKLATALEAEANKYRARVPNSVTAGAGGTTKPIFKPEYFTAEDLNNIRSRTNADLDAFFSKDALAQSIDRNKSTAGMIATRTANDAVRNLLYDEVAKVAGTDAPAIAQLKRTEGDLLNMRQSLWERTDALRNRAAFERGAGAWQRLRDNIRGYGSTHGTVGGHINLNSAMNAVRPEAQAELSRVNKAADVFQPRPYPWSRVASYPAIAAVLSGRSTQ